MRPSTALRESQRIIWESVTMQRGMMHLLVLQLFGCSCGDVQSRDTFRELLERLLSLHAYIHIQHAYIQTYTNQFCIYHECTFANTTFDFHRHFI
jgi:hypothetical protein